MRSKSLLITKAWNSAIAKAGIENFRFHDLRHSAASYLVMNGASFPEVGEILGHKIAQMTKRYAPLADSHTHRIVAAMNEQIMSPARATIQIDKNMPLPPRIRRGRPLLYPWHLLEVGDSFPCRRC